ncbi:hypothetical protein SY89_00694 [Halolamina pelagica]|uniref:Uncharacterized protein n=1 Tax=Halolamina pelagica TaxID=699431 RepID=A0A0P7HTK4_9EURY|nr:hypothetical protein [Halolamina pelagica]KPN29974.1 hypothetical protein SY89_00694 [Halolamina pelagica]
MAEAMLTDRPAVPRWLLSPEAARDPPEWVPAGYDRPGSVTCGDCGAEASVRRVVTRDGRDEPAGFRCPDCWERPPL